MISADLLDEILAVTPTWDGVHRPARVEADPSGPAKSTSGEEPVEIVESFAVAAPAEETSTSTRRIPRKKLARMLLSALHERPGSSAYDLMMLVRRRGARFDGAEPRNTVDRALARLEADGFAQRIELSSRDQKTHGARFLWEAA